MHKLSAVLPVLGIVLTTPSVWASPEFPSVVESELSMVCPPTCLLCHSTDPGQAGTANKAFASTLKRFGLQEGDEGSLQSALSQLAMQSPATDTDGDGFSDLDELKADTPSDPSDKALTPALPGDTICDAQVNYGCGATIAPQPQTSNGNASFWTFALLTTLGVALRRQLWAGGSRRPSRRA